jgi:hypothetical protein
MALVDAERKELARDADPTLVPEVPTERIDGAANDSVIQTAINTLIIVNNFSVLIPFPFLSFYLCTKRPQPQKTSSAKNVHVFNT